MSDKSLFGDLQNQFNRMYIKHIETVGGTSVSSGSWGEDSYCESAGAVHFHVASPAYKIKKFEP
jgi:hypothetical protein